MHLEAVAERAASYGANFAARDLAKVLGSLHDLGKYDELFLGRLQGTVARHDHSTAGACVAIDRFGRVGKLLAYAIAGHHAGLADGVRDERADSARRPLEERLCDG